MCSRSTPYGCQSASEDRQGGNRKATDTMISVRKNSTHKGKHAGNILINHSFNEIAYFKQAHGHHLQSKYQSHDLSSVWCLGESLSFLHGYRPITLKDHVELVNYIRQGRKPNIYGCRIYLHTRWNIPLMWQLAESVSDKETVPVPHVWMVPQS